LEPSENLRDTQTITTNPIRIKTSFNSTLKGLTALSGTQRR
jgi:hypothetical protein